MIDKELVAQTLEKAADLIETKGWAQGGTGRGPAGEMCMSVALWEARNDHFLSLEYAALGNAYHVALREAMSLPMCSCERIQCGSGIPLWNDDPGRTKQDVLDALRKTALTVREKVE